MLAYRADLGRFSTSAWADATTQGGNTPGYYSSLVGQAGGLLKDMGKTIVSASRTFRKIQLVDPSRPSASTFGVGGKYNVDAADFLTGYIELGFEGTGVAAKVAKFGR